MGMSEADAIAQNPLPNTRASLGADLRRLGVHEGEVLLVHSSLSALGWVVGGAVAVIQALQDVLTPAGTLVMPTHTTHLTDPAGWRNPPVPESWWPTIRTEFPAFDPTTTPTRGMGQIPELFRTWPDVQRSNHPHSSFAAWGKEAAFVTHGHTLAFSLGECSPLARIYELGGRVLLLGTEKNTSLHLAEVRAGTRPTVTVGAPVATDMGQTWITFEECDYDDDAFPPAKAAFEASGAVTVGKVGAATAKLMDQRELVNFAVAFWRSTPDQPSAADKD